MNVSHLLFHPLPIRHVDDRDQEPGECLLILPRDGPSNLDILACSLERSGHPLPLEKSAPCRDGDEPFSKDLVGLLRKDLPQALEKILLALRLVHLQSGLVDIQDLHHGGRLIDRLGVVLKIFPEVRDTLGPQLLHIRLHFRVIFFPE